MEKKIFIMALCMTLAWGLAAQNTINFAAGTPAQKGLSRENAEALRLKVEQILARNNAGTTSADAPYTVQPELVRGETARTEGLLRDVTLVTGELSLTARNSRDGSVYATLVVELKGDATGSEEQAVASLIAGIKVTDRAFVRFIRTARKRIAAATAQPVDGETGASRKGGTE